MPPRCAKWATLSLGLAANQTIILQQHNAITAIYLALIGMVELQA
jgi:hypothetical protein